MTPGTDAGGDPSQPLAASASSGTRAEDDLAAPTSLSPWLLVAIVVVTTGALHAATSSPCAWLDTFNDERLVQACLDGHCSLEGVPSSQPGIVHANGWLFFRTLLESLGLDLGAAHWALQISCGVAFALLAWTAARLGGTWAATITLTQIPSILSGLALEAVYNSGLLPLVGTIQAMAAIAFAMRPSAQTAIAYAAVGAVATNVHSQCATALVSVIWIALVAGGPRRWRLAAIGSLTFVALTFVFAPAGWIDDASAVLDRLRAGPGPHAPAHQGRSPSWSDLPLIVTAVYGISLLRRTDEASRALRRRLDGAVGELGPPVLAYVVLGLAGVIDADRKYLLHVTPAAAIALGVAITGAFRLAPARLRARVGPVLVRTRRWAPWAVLATFVPLVLGTSSGSPSRALAIGDVEAIARALRDEGWSGTQMSAATSSTEVTQLLDGWLAMHPAWFETIDPDAPLDVRALVVIPRHETPVPAGVRAMPGGAWLALVHTHLDFRRFEACVTREGVEAPTCAPASMIRERPSEHGEAAYGVPGLPFPERDVRRVTIRLPWNAPEGTEERIVMPQLAEMCGGRITGVPPGSLVDADEHAARLVGGHAGELTLTWELGGPACVARTFPARPPFFLSGTSAEVEPLAASLTPARAEEAR